MEAIASWYENSLGTWMPKEVFVTLVSMIPLIELRGGIVVGRLLNMSLLSCNIFCIIGNIIPIPFILLFIRRIFSWMKEKNVLTRFVAFLETRAANKESGRERGQFVFLWLFVGIPIPGTGAWTGSLIASLFEYDIKKASLAIFLGILTAAVIMDTLAYLVPGLIL
ncbi:MAG: small multi-drug export protein [Lachnospiraceae bacterium]|nr:small multi-drug export protein [Lachnospiraceae bacterium]